MSWPEGALERLEGLEQLRFLEQAVKVRCVLVEGKGRVFWELNNPVDVARIEGCSLYKSDAADDRLGVDCGGRRTIKKKNE